MRQTKEILRQKWLLGRSHRQIAAGLGVSAGVVGETMRRAKAAGLGEYAEVEALAPSALEARLYPSAAMAARPLPDFPWLHRERRRAGVTLELLHLEYLEQHPGGYVYTQFCEHYRAWLGQRGATMRQLHHAGEKTFVDYSGKRPCIWDPKTGERIEVELFVAVLGASNYTFVEATGTQRGPDWIGGDGEDLCLVRPGAAGMQEGLLRKVPPRLLSLRRARRRARRRQLRALARQGRTGRRARDRRLGTHPCARARAA